ncbi:E3 ubiquitin-protein ligase BRE1-like 1 isoform X1 [Zingiber officinale]|uniref:E3 ubiquitin-protein ligase BRE1-like 1 isoform X1 n=2 Tax=Zingiber officinale TaxID=94328 RepID=UPI001C4BA9E5|nr:E3 ubiquitin-protein ligase BRE1-like 1 isoform X1 [Zingiber officinale]
MGSTGEPVRKRRYFSPISPTSAGTTKKQPFSPRSEDKKLDVAVLRYKNQKLSEQLEAQKFEYLTLENKFHQIKEKQKTHEDMLLLVNNNWERLLSDLDSLSASTSGSSSAIHLKCSHLSNGGSSFSIEEDFLRRLLETGATECSEDASPTSNQDDTQTEASMTKSILKNLISLLNDVWHVNEAFSSACLATLPEDEPSRKLLKVIQNLEVEVRNFLVAVGDLHLKHRSMTDDLLNHQDIDLKNKAECKRLAEELASTVAELEENNCRISKLKLHKSTTQSSYFLFPNFGNKQVAGDKVKDAEKDMQHMESSLKELMGLVSSRLEDIKRLHEDRIEILKKLADMRNALMDFKKISSSKAFVCLSDRLNTSKEEMDQCRVSLEKLQVEKDSFIWWEKEVNLKHEIADVGRTISFLSESRIAELQQILQKLADERVMLENKLEAATRESSREEIIQDFKTLAASLPKSMEIMQSEIDQKKEATVDLHSLRAEVQSLSSLLHRKENEIKTLFGTSSHQLSEIKQLHTTVQDLRDNNHELKLFIEMYRRESTDSRDLIVSKDNEYKAWAHVHTLKSSLDEHNLELRVKAAIEAEATSQKRLTSAEAEIDELRQKLETCERDLSKLSEILTSKQEEGRTYLSEIECIGQSYVDMQTQNQHLLQQIIERDDYNIKLVMEGTKEKQVQEALRLEIQITNRKLQEAKLLMDSYDLRVSKMDEQLKIWSEQVGKLAEDARQSRAAFEHTMKRLLEIQMEAQKSRQLLDLVQNKVEGSRLEVANLLIEIEEERFNKKRIEESLDDMTRKAAYLRAQTKGSVLEKLQQEVKEYRGILKCSICLDRQKEVVIAKCYHLFCYQCIRRTISNRQRKCPTCGSSFGANDVKPIYI